MAQKISVGSQVKFMLGETPMLGTILFAAGPDHAAVRLNSGAEIRIALESIVQVAG